MKCILILFDEENCFENEKVFGEKSARDLCLCWAESVAAEKQTCVKILKKRDVNDFSELLFKMKNLAEENHADYVVYSYADLPFINLSVTERMIKSHETYKSEYTFADGYSIGLSPELIDKGTLGILYELSKTSQNGMEANSVSRDAIWELIKTDVNSFDVESILSDKDFRLLRYSFDCSSKLNFISCRNLFESLENKNDILALDAEKLCQTAENLSGVLKTVPSFYNIQICSSINTSSIYNPYEAEYTKKYNKSPFDAKDYMALEKVFSLIDQAAQLSEKAVIGLSLNGEAFNHPDILKIIEKIISYEGLSVFIETDGLKITEEICSSLSEINRNAVPGTNGWQRIMIAVALDSFTAETYALIHKNNYFNQVVKNISLLCTALPGSIYPQFTRMNQNEEELENFYRYWSEKSNASGGELIIQKYDDYAGLLPECKPADLSPIERNVCWHLRRDMTIRLDGSVPVCKEWVLEDSEDNVFTDGIEKIWNKNISELKNHINKNYCTKCGKCDEYYTFFF